MITQSEELLHEFKAVSDWEENFHINFIDKKNKIYCYLDIEFFPKKKAVSATWSLIFNKIFYENAEDFDFEVTPGIKNLSFKNLKYKVLSPESFEIFIKNNEIEAKLFIQGQFVIYDYPNNAGKNIDLKDRSSVTPFKRYAQKCAVTGTLTFKKGDNKGNIIDVDGVGIRKHQWGQKNWKDLVNFSNFNIYYKDLLVNLSYYNYNEQIVNGFFARKSGNIPVINVDFEHIEVDKKTHLIKNSEISYTDAQDDRDLIVSNNIFSLQMKEKKYGTKKFYCYRAFSDFIIIGTGKRGIGFEEHFFFKDEIKNLINTQ